MAALKHFLDIDQLDSATLRGILDHAVTLKAARAKRARGARDATRLLEGRVLAMVFEKQSLRTRVSFDVAMRQLGGDTIVLRGDELQLGRGETVADTARVLSRYVDGIMIRTDRPSKLDELASYATVPVINGLTDASHPCQVMTDVMTFEEKKGPIRNRTIAWVGDGNNMAASWIHAAVRFDFELRLACPPSLSPEPALLDWAAKNQGRVQLTTDPKAAVRGSDCVITDTWVSMGSEPGNRHDVLKPYQVNGLLMAEAKSDAVFMHCLPAHRGEEVTAEIMDSPSSIVFDEAENRVHAQKAILAWCMA